MKKQIKINVRKSVKEWFAKIQFINNQIDSLEKLKQFPIISISVLLLKSQLIEFELKQLITALDLHIYFSNTSKILKRQTRTPKDLNKLSLGDIVHELREFKNGSLFNLIGNLNKFNTIRIKFVHYLLDSETNIPDLTNDSKLGLELAKEIFKQIKQIEELLNQNDPLKIS